MSKRANPHKLRQKQEKKLKKDKVRRKSAQARARRERNEAAAHRRAYPVLAVLALMERRLRDSSSKAA